MEAKLVLQIFTLVVIEFCIANAQQKTCQFKKRFNCLYNTPGKERSENLCQSLAPYCRWCPDQKPMRSCQTHDRACLVEDHIEVPGSLSQGDCESQGYVYCSGDVKQKCVFPEPARSVCFKRNLPDPCEGSEDISNEVACHQALCVWCGLNSITRMANQCWKMPDEARCNEGESCCKAICSSDLSACVSKGCSLCRGDVITHCVIEPPPDLPEVCPDAFNAEDCFAGVEYVDQTEQFCDDLCCSWCIESGAAVCKRDSYPAQCNAVQQTFCPVAGLFSSLECKSQGCEWCGANSDKVECQASTWCTTCSCPARTECCAKTPQACEMKGCMWCESATDFKCMNVNSSGVIGAGVWSECSKSCGGGSQWQYDPNCNEPSFFMCPRIHRTCNDQACPVKDICSDGEMPRHVEAGTCCMSHSCECGRNPFNAIQTALEGSKRRKRVVNGEDITSIENYPWMAVIYVDGVKRCTGTVVSDQHVVTHSSCFNESYSDIEIIFKDYDRSVTPNITRASAGVTMLELLAVIELDVALSAGEYHPLCLPGGEFPMVDTDCIVAGWGLTSNDTSCVPRAHAAVVRTMPWGLCAQAWDAEGITEEEYFCAGIPEGGPDACTGDVGAALICQRCENCAWYFAGVATEHLGCGSPQTTSVYVKVLNYESTLFSSAAIPILDPGPYSCE